MFTITFCSVVMMNDNFKKQYYTPFQISIFQIFDTWQQTQLFLTAHASEWLIKFRITVADKC